MYSLPVITTYNSNCFILRWSDPFVFIRSVATIRSHNAVVRIFYKNYRQNGSVGKRIFFFYHFFPPAKIDSCVCVCVNIFLSFLCVHGNNVVVSAEGYFSFFNPFSPRIVVDKIHSLVAAAEHAIYDFGLLLKRTTLLRATRYPTYIVRRRIL